MAALPLGIRALAKKYGVKLRVTAGEVRNPESHYGGRKGLVYWAAAGTVGEQAPTALAQAYRDPDYRPVVIMRPCPTGQHYEAVLHELAHIALDELDEDLVVEQEIAWLENLPEVQRTAVQESLVHGIKDWGVSSPLIDAWLADNK